MRMVQASLNSFLVQALGVCVGHVLSNGESGSDGRCSIVARRGKPWRCGGVSDVHRVCVIG